MAGDGCSVALRWVHMTYNPVSLSLQETCNVTKCRESRAKLEENVETLKKTHTDLLHSRDKCALDIKV